MQHHGTGVLFGNSQAPLRCKYKPSAVVYSTSLTVTDACLTATETLAPTFTYSMTKYATTTIAAARRATRMPWAHLPHPP